MHLCVCACVNTWDLEEEVVGYRVAGPSLLNDNTGQKVIVVNGNGSMVVHYQCGSDVRYLLHPMDLIAWYTGQIHRYMRYTCSRFH